MKHTSAFGPSSNELGRAEKRRRPQGRHRRAIFWAYPKLTGSKPKVLVTLTAFSPHVAVNHASERKTLAFMVRAMALRPFTDGEPSFPSMERPKRPLRLGIMARAVRLLAEEFFVVRGTR